MKKMTNGKEIKFVADALVSTYQNRGYYMEGEELCSHPSEDTEVQTSVECNAETDGHGLPEMAESSGSDAASCLENAVENQFACPVCGKVYAKKAYLDKHISDKHSQE